LSTAACAGTSVGDVAEQPAEAGVATSAPNTTTTAPTTIAPTGVTAADLCTQAQLIEPSPQIDTTLLPETSGISYSRQIPGRLYAHNDSGNLPRLFGIGPDSTIEFVWSIDSALLDWEDMAAAGNNLYLADTGDNFHLRPNVRLLKVPEPDDTTRALTPITIWTFGYEPGRLDAEAVLVDVDESQAVIITKGLDNPAQVFELPLADPGSTTPLLTPILELDLGLITAADITADGRVVGLRTPDRILLVDRAPGATIADALQGPFCEAPSAPERQGEAFAFHLDGQGYTTLSERESSTRNDFRIRS